MKTHLLAAVAALSLSAPAVAAELVTNGGFETGTLAGWTLSGNIGFAGVGPSAANSGNFGFADGALGSDGILSQTVATIAGKTYSYSFALRNTGGRPNNFSASLGGTAFGPVFVDTAALGYSIFSGSVIAPTTNATLSFSFRSDPAFWNFDDVSLASTTVPEPASWALMIGGFAAVGIAARRRRTVVAA